LINKLDTLVLFSFAKNAACAVIFSCVFETVTQKYGERGYRFALLEAGGMAHALTLTATACGVHSAQMGGIVDTTVEDLLDIDGSLESVIHSVFLG
jgi:SagB-type dehydrogenase family enzyme